MPAAVQRPPGSQGLEMSKKVREMALDLSGSGGCFGYLAALSSISGDVRAGVLDDFRCVSGGGAA